MDEVIGELADIIIKQKEIVIDRQVLIQIIKDAIKEELSI